MAKQLNVNLAFTADTSKAKSQLQELQNQLSKLTSAPAQQLNLKWTQEIQEATTAAMELKTHLKNAMNVETGTLDFTKLNSSIKSSGKSLSEYGRQLQSLGPAGQQAFMQLAGAVAQSEIPIRRSNAALKEMMTTLKNTARWQLSSSMLHGFMGAVQSAYGYAQDLNASLNDIRIVTGQTTDQMAKFAEQANKAAKALSTNTTDYTNASLIYYQQGLSDAEVAKRTEVTVKMANAAGQSAQVVSDQLTSVWNNFYDGSKSLEYYADVMTALGAATASSTDEIAGGLEKFAAVADTIGLSYEYAASALATITSNTRQSEEVVGTALKTIFARIQGLNLGETLEDGTTLNKYSEALQKVGISIFESNGEIKKMDDILDEMASKWQTLAKDQQIALAQTVAGVRQYNQLVSLMDNWNVGDADSMTANLKTAYGASGELQKQADIYAESWEAAQERVQAASEGIFQSLIDEDFFIGVLNGLEKVLTYIDNTIDSLGGLKGVLSSVGVLLTKVFSDQMAQGLRNMAHNIYMSTEGGRQTAKQAKYDALDDMQRQMSLGYDGTGSISGETASQQYAQQIAMQKELISNSEKMSQSEIANAQQLLDLRRQIGDQVIRAAEAEEKAKDRLADSKQKAYREMGEFKGEAGISIDDIDKFNAISNSMKKIVADSQSLEGAFKNVVSTIDSGSEDSESAMQELSQAVKNVGMELNLSEDDITNYLKAFKQGGEEAAKAYEKLMGLLNAKQGRNQASMQALGIDKKTAQDIVDNYGQIRNAIDKKAEAERRAKLAQEEYKKSIQSAKGVVKDWANSIVSGAQAVMSFVSIINSISGAIDTLTNPDATGWEKFISVLQSGAMVMMMTVSMMNSIVAAKKNWEAGTLKNAAATLIEAAATSLSTKANEKNARAQHKKAAGHAHDSKEATKDAAATTLEGKTTEKNNKSLSKSFSNLGTSIREYISAYKTQIGGMLLITASIAAVVATISIAINQYNEAAINAENAAKAAEQLSNQYQDVKTNYENFISTVNNYEDVVSGMEALTKGTAEYNEQLLQANESAMELINKYDLIGKYSIQGGLIVFDEGVLEEAQTQYLSTLGRAQAAAYAGQVAASHLTGQSNQTNLNRNINSASDTGWYAANTGVTTGIGAAAGAGLATGGAMIAGMFTGATVGSSVPVIGTIIGAIVGLIAGGITMAISGAESAAEDAALDNITQYVAKNGDGIFAAQSWEEFDKMLADAELEIDDKNLVKSLYANRDAVRELTLTEVARLEREEANFEAGFAAYNMGNVAYTGLTVGQGYLNEQASNYREENIDRVRSEVNDLWSGSNDDFWAQYLRYVYDQQEVDVDNTSGENVRIRDLGGGAVTVEKKNAEGVWETFGDKDGLDEDAAQEQLVNALLLKEASEAMDFGQLNKFVADLEKAGLELEKDSILMDDILSQYGDSGTINLSQFSVSDVMNMDPDSIEDEGLRNALNTAIANYEDQMTEAQQRIINSQWYKGLTEDQQDFVWTLDIDEDDTVAEVQRAYEAGQEWLNSHSLVATLTVAEELEDLLSKEKKTAEDWTAIKTAYDTFLKENPGAMDWQEFMKLSQEQQIEYITNFGEATLGEAEAAAQNSVDNANQAVIDASNDLQAANKTVKATTDAAEAATEDVTTKLDALDTQYESQFGNYVMAVGTDLQGNVSYANGNGAFTNEHYQFDWGAFNNFLTGVEFAGPEVQSLLQDAVTYSQGLYDNGYVTDNHAEMMDGLDATVRQLAIAFGYDPETDFEGYSNFVNQVTTSLTRQGSAVSPDTYGWNLLLGGLDTLYRNQRADIDAEDDDEVQAQTDAETRRDKEQEQYNTALDNQVKAYQDQQLVQDYIESDVEKLGFEMSVYEEQRRQLIATNAELENQTMLLHDLTKIQLRAARGVKTMADNQENWKKVIKDSNRQGIEYLEIVGEIRNAYADVFDLDSSVAETLSAEFLTSETSMNLMTEALKGNEEAWDNWKFAVADAIVTDDIEAQVRGLVNTTLNSVMQDIAEFNFEAEGIEIGASVEDTAFWSALDNMQTGSVEAAQAISNALSSMGVDAKIVKHTVHEDGSERLWNTSGQMIDGDGNLVSVEAQASMTSSPVVSTYYTLEGATYNGKGVTPPSGGSSGGGGGSKPKKAKEVKKTEVVKRYKEIDDSLDDLADKMDDAAKAADRLYGKGRIDQMKKNNELLKQEIELTKKKKEEALKYLDEDKKAMFDAASEAGVKLNIDENGLITNYTSAMTELYEELDAEITAANKDGNADEEETERIDAIQKRIDELQSAIDQYDETRELIEDLDNQLDEQFYQWQDNNYEILTYELEIKLELNDDELKLVDYHLNKIADDFYQMAEAAALMVDAESSLTGGSQLDVYKQNLEDYQAQKEALDTAYANGEISQDAYIEGLREVQDGMLSNLESLNELDDSMMHYYGETLNMAMEEMAKYTERMEHLTSVLDHYQSLMEIMGKSTDYKSMGVVLEGKAKTLEHQTDVAKQAMEMYKTEADERYAVYQQALLDGDSAAAELYLQQYEDALAAANQAEEEYLASAEEWAEALTAVLENKLSELGQTLENALTGGTSFDQLTTSMERAAALQEEYLTTTNKIYETNKLMRQAQQEIDKTSNTVAKRRLQSFIQETNQLQNQTKLSNYELEIQQAKYDLLLAEIALEEAQNAKSTVRLQRDNEGNFGYVYTADGAAVAEAEQDMLDKQNRLYNLALDGANEYSEKYQQTLNEMYDTLTDLQQQYLDGAFETEQEYHAAVEAAKQYYYEKLQQYSSLHTVAITLDTRVINDAWSSGFNDMIANTEEWMGAVDIYINQVGDAFTRWGEYMDQIAADTGTDLDSLEENVKDITDESEALKETLIGEDGVIDAIQAEIDAVVDVTEKYATLRNSLLEIKKTYEDLAVAIRAAVAAQSATPTEPNINSTSYTPDSGGSDGSVGDNLDTGDTPGSGNPPTNPTTPPDDSPTNPSTPVMFSTYAYSYNNKYYGPYNSAEAAANAAWKAHANDSLSVVHAKYEKRLGLNGGKTMAAFVGTVGDLRTVGKSSGNSTGGGGGGGGRIDRVALGANAHFDHFDTGGYTGVWGGSYGKMAMLHQKELVLNQGDTENFLTAMGVLDRIVQTIDLQSANAQLGGLLMSPTLGYNRNDVLEQNIKIEASFPNATDKIEIEEAFMSLANLASQYANRK